MLKTTFGGDKGAPMTYEELEALDSVIQYLWEDEQRDFMAEGKPQTHIFRDLELLEEYLHTNHEN